MAKRVVEYVMVSYSYGMWGNCTIMVMEIYFNLLLGKHDNRYLYS